MRRFQIREDVEFTAELRALIPDARESDEMLHAIIDYLSMLGDAESQISGTDLYFKTVPDPAHRRFLVLYYHLRDEIVTLRSVQSFPEKEAEYDF